MTVRPPILVLDFDGTICLGDGPVWAYADGVLPHLPTGVAGQLRDALTAYLSGQSPNGFADGYSAIAEVAGPHVRPGVLDTAYAHSRLALEDPRLDIRAPAGLAELLAHLAGTVRRIVVTNSPTTGLTTALDRIGLTAGIDEVVHSAGKPTGWSTILPRLLADAEPSTLLSVGDIWINDIAPVLAANCATAFVDRTGHDLRPAHVRAQRIEELYPAIEAWAASPEEFSSVHRPSSPTPDGSTP